MRPIEYNETVVAKAQEYLDSCKDEEYERVKTEGEKSTTWDNLVRVKLPTIEGLAVYLKVSRSTVYEWKGKYEEFSDIIEQLQALQAERLLNNGLSGTYNPTIAKVLLTKHGYVERAELTGKDGERLIDNEMSYEQAKAIIAGREGGSTSNSQE